MQTKEIVTASGNKIVIKSFLSYNDLESSLKIEDTIEKSNKIIETAIISVNGVTENAYQILRTLPISEYKEVSTEITSMINGGFIPAK